MLKYEKRNTTTRLMIFQTFGELRKNEHFREKIEKYKISNFEKGNDRNVLDEEALYESSVRKLG